MFLQRHSLSVLLAVCLLGVATLLADPPGAMVSSKLQVPNALHTGTFAQDRYLNLPPGFQISLYAIVPGSRFLTLAPNGDILVSQPGSGKITLLRPDPNGGAPSAYTYASGLNQPQGMVFHTLGTTTYLYISETTQVSRYVYRSGDTSAPSKQVIISNLPTGGSHPLKNIAIGADDKLYVALGSSCNVCTQDTTSSPQRGAIYVYNADGSGGRLFAQGLRNAEGLAILPGSNQLWVVMNNRDDIPYPVKDSTGSYGKVVASYVDGHPPDLFTSVRDGGNYGWPFCDSNPDNGLDRMPFLPDFDVNADARINCAAMDLPDKGIQAHSAPLGLSFLQGTGFAAPYANGAVVGLHGSWDRSVPTGYKVIWYPMNPGPGTGADLVTGWLDSSLHAWGRPVAAVPDAAGSLLISDDMTGAIYRLTYAPAALSAASGYGLLAPESLASVYGANFAPQTVSVTSPQWPLSLGGVSVTVQDSAGGSRAAPISYVSYNQINFEIPAGTALGNASLTLQTPNGPVNEGTVTIAAVAPSLFTASGNGVGAAAASAVSIDPASGIQAPWPVASCPNGPLSCVTVPIPVTGAAPVFLSLYGTGIRGRSSLSNLQVTIGNTAVPVLYAGPQGTFPGLDQVNVSLPLTLEGAGQLNVVLTVDGQTANTVQIAVQ